MMVCCISCRCILFPLYWWVFIFYFTTRTVRNSNLIWIPIDLQFGKSCENLKGNFHFLTGHGPISQILPEPAQPASFSPYPRTGGPPSRPSARPVQRARSPPGSRLTRASNPVCTVTWPGLSPVLSRSPANTGHHHLRPCAAPPDLLDPAPARAPGVVQDSSPFCTRS
jgi:hypothetical protein